MEMTLIEILCISVAINAAAQPESFDQQDEKEHQDQYESRYYAKPEHTRSTIGKFLLLKMKGEIHSDNSPYDLFLPHPMPPSFGRPRLFAGFKFPFPMPPFAPQFLRPAISAPFSYPTLHHQFPNSFNPDHETENGRKFFSIAKLFAELATRKPFSEMRNEFHQLEKPDESWFRNMSPPNPPDLDLQVTHAMEVHHPDSPFSDQTPHLIDDGQDESTEDDDDEQRYLDYDPAKQHDMFDSSFRQFLKQDGSQQWPMHFKWTGKENKNKSFSYNPDESSRFKCHCRPFAHDWSRAKRCAAFWCAMIPYKRN